MIRCLLKETLGFSTNKNEGFRWLQGWARFFRCYDSQFQGGFFCLGEKYLSKLVVRLGGGFLDFLLNFHPDPWQG